MPKPNTTCFLLTLIFVLALFLRLYQLSSIPYGFHFDEAKAAWNSLSLLKTGFDDHGHKLPLYYDSFGDFRPTGIFYLIIPSLIAFGQTIFAIRFPAALFGALTIFPVFFLVRHLKNTRLAILAALFLALSPWHISVSRATSEVVISLFFSTFALYYSLKKNIFWAVLFFIISFFFYHSIRILAPVFLLILVVYYRSPKILIIFFFVSLTSLLLMSSKESRGRLSQVSLVSDFRVSYEVQKMPAEEGPNKVFVARFFHNKIAAYLKVFLDEYKNYFSTEFFLGDSSKPVRYRTPYFGLISYFDFILLIFGLMAVTKHKELPLIWILLLLSPLPSAVTIEDTPNLHRAMSMVPFLAIIEAYGFYLISKTKKFTKPILFIFCSLYSLNFIYFLHLYFSHGKFGLSSYYRNGGVFELSQKIKTIQNQYDLIIFTSHNDNPSPWIAFFGDKNPSDFNQNYRKLSSGDWQYQNMVFGSQPCPSLTVFTQHPNTRLLVVDGEACQPPLKLTQDNIITLVDTIQRPDNSPPFKLWAWRTFPETQ